MAKMQNVKKKNKNIKKNKNVSKIDGIGGLDSEIWSKIITVIIVFVVLGLFYLLTLYITGKNSNDTKSDNTTPETTISYDNIILGKSFSMSDDDYLVIYYDKSDEDISNTYSSLVSSYQGTESPLKVYTVDMSSALNKGNATDGESNRNPANASELAIHGPTLIHYSNHTVVEYFEGEAEISEYFN